MTEAEPQSLDEDWLDRLDIVVPEKYVNARDAFDDEDLSDDDFFELLGS